jgi:hypothetical protein
VQWKDWEHFGIQEEIVDRTVVVVVVVVVVELGEMSEDLESFDRWMKIHLVAAVCSLQEV